MQQRAAGWQPSGSEAENHPLPLDDAVELYAAIACLTFFTVPLPKCNNFAVRRMPVPLTSSARMGAAISPRRALAKAE